MAKKNGKKVSKESATATKTPEPLPEIPEDVCAICGAVFNTASKAQHAHPEIAALAETVDSLLGAYVAFQKSFASRFRTGKRDKASLENAIGVMEQRGANAEIVAAMKRELELANLENRKVKGLAFERRRTLFKMSKLLHRYLDYETFRVTGKMVEREISQE